MPRHRGPCYVATVESPSAESQRVFAPGILRDQVAIVTGGGSGIGLATAAEFVRLGARVAICGRTADKLEAARAQLVALLDPHTVADSNDRVIAKACDIREPQQVEDFVRTVL